MNSPSARWTALLVDDERLARVELRRLLQAHPHIEVVGEASDVAGAAERVRLTGADVVFLDLQLHQEHGLTLVPLLPTDVRVICVTAHDRYAVDAFGARVLDYLLKPVDPARLADSIDRLGPPPPASGEGTTHDESDERTPLHRVLSIRDRLFLRMDGVMGFLPVAGIRCIEADRDHTMVHLHDGRTVVVRKSLSEWIVRLPAAHFQQIHRSTIINLDVVERIEEWSHRSYHVWLRGHRTPVVMSRRFAKRLRADMR